jgi:hypothetical protein
MKALAQRRGVGQVNTIFVTHFDSQILCGAGGKLWQTELGKYMSGPPDKEVKK